MVSDPAVIVAAIGGVVTLLGLLISGIFGLISTTSQRESAASAGVEKAMNERITFKDEQIQDCREDLARANQKIMRLERENEDKDLEIWELRGQVHAYKVGRPLPPDDTESSDDRS